MYHFRQAVQDNEMAPDEWNVEAVEDHRGGDDGAPEFLVKWEGSEERTWEPLRHFFHRYSWPVLAYCDKKKVKVPDVLGYLYRHEPEVVVNNIVSKEASQDWPWSDQDTDNDGNDMSEGEDHPAANARGFHGVLRAACRNDQRRRADEMPKGQGDPIRAQPRVTRTGGAPR